MNAGAIVEDLFGTQGWADPYPIYVRAQALGPVVPVGPSTFLVSSHRAVNQVLRTTAFGASSGEVGPERDDRTGTGSMDLLARSMLESNQPRHTRMRTPIAAVFTPRRIAALEPAVTLAVERLLDGMAEAGADGAVVDFMDRLAYALPVRVICELLGVPEADRYRFRELAHDLTRALEFRVGPEELVLADEAGRELAEYFGALAARRRADPQDDLVSALVSRPDEGGPDDGGPDVGGPDSGMSDPELVANLVLLLFAGFETTTNLLGNGLALLFQYPAVRQALAGGGLAPALFVDEVLRYDSPVQLTSRVALVDGLEIEGVPVPRQAEVLLLLGAANRDPARFAEPERFDPWRADNAPLSFGAGIHYCLGAMLARLEAAVAFPALLARFPAIAPAGDAAAVRQDRIVLRGYAELPVRLGR